MTWADLYICADCGAGIVDRSAASCPECGRVFDDPDPEWDEAWRGIVSTIDEAWAAARLTVARRIPESKVDRLGFLRWHWQILHPRTNAPLLAGTEPTRRSAQRHATRAADHWITEYGHLLSP